MIFLIRAVLRHLLVRLLRMQRLLRRTTVQLSWAHTLLLHGKLLSLHLLHLLLKQPYLHLLLLWSRQSWQLQGRICGVLTR